MTGDMWRVGRGEAGYPPALLDLHDPPEVLYGLGDRALVTGLDPERTVTIVGARRAGAYGLEVAESLGSSLAAAGLIVVSGMALGADSAAHRGALEAGGATIAVLGGGADVVYPARERRLYSRIRASGAVISERPPGTRPETWSFPARNRIMAALSRMTVVVEAADPSGSLLTADRALEIGRDVGAVPGPVTARNSAGTNRLIREGASLIRGPGDVLDCLLGAGAAEVFATGPALDAALQVVLDSVDRGNTTPDGLALATGTEGREMAVALARLELLGYVRADPDGRYSRTALTAPG